MTSSSLLDSPESMPSALFTSSSPSPPTPAAVEMTLRNMTSLSPVAKTTTTANNANKRLSLSPSSIPSSPTSIHSSSSAIFERDIEPLPMPLLSPLSPSSPQPTTNPHRIPRAKGTEAVDASVPTVLDSAAAILAESHNNYNLIEDVTIITPAHNQISISLLNALEQKQYRGWASPSSFRSRSASPDGGALALSIPGSLPRSTASSPVSVGRAMILDGQSAPSSPPSSFPASLSPIQSQTQRQQPASPQIISKRLSFISHADLLSATPSNAVSLNWITSHAGETSADSGTRSPPAGGQTRSNRSSVFMESFHPSPVIVPAAVASPSKSNRSSMLLDSADREALGGEWEREGLGKGLEARLGI